ncbi:hypothetical protein K227x_55310 [Rubripirellula lacrimiformis]|uniref:Uncharacterized protein n=1 Tax=Rubripirellula lacrimiformis TaxID=1930273 RepID=A0A517NIZ5_9BACT|nr:hypothetical protein [Rubripirellula lacrimiformis]QDT07106.1 hypothetical protein K227x_55310 [Rubripirellula lacrimiformis]
MKINPMQINPMTTTRSFFLLLMLAGSVGLTGCKQNATDAVTTDQHEHDHADDGSHDHDVAGHAHGIGPHQGVIADWGGGKYHVEFTVDHDQQQATVYVLGGDESTATPIDAESIELRIKDPEMTVTLAPSPQEQDPAGTASRFVGTHEKLGVVQEYEGTMTGLIDGTPYSGDFKEEAHDH